MPSQAITSAIDSEPEFQTAINRCVDALKGLASYQLDPAINEGMQTMGERKEFLDEAEYKELLSLIDFSEKRTREKLEAQSALKQLGEFIPEVLASN